MTRENIIRLEGMLGRAYTLALRVMDDNRDEQVLQSLAEDVSGECAELLALIDGDMGAFGEPQLIDPELQSIAVFLNRESA